MANPFDRLYIHESGKFNAEFIRLCEINFGMSSKGAEKHYQLLVNHVPTGWAYHGETTEEHAFRTFGNNPKFMIIKEIDLFDGDGNPSHDNEVLVVKKIEDE